MDHLMGSFSQDELDERLLEASLNRRLRELDSDSDDDEEIRKRALEVNDPEGIKFLESAEEGDIETLKKMLETKPELLQFYDTDKYTALHRAAYAEKADAAKFLLENGANINARTLDGWTPLHSACKWNAAKIVRLLLENGADINAKSEGGLTPLHVAAENPTAHDTLILLLLNQKLDADVKNPHGETAEITAMQHGSLGYLFELARKSINHI